MNIFYYLEFFYGFIFFWYKTFNNFKFLIYVVTKNHPPTIQGKFSINYHPRKLVKNNNPLWIIGNKETKTKFYLKKILYYKNNYLNIKI